MAFVAKSIIVAPYHPAPKEYEAIDVIAGAKPKGTYEAVALQQLNKTNVVAWYVMVGSDWKLASGYYVISKEQVKHQRGARYTKEKEAFINKYWDDLFSCIIRRNLNWKHPDCVRLIRLAQDEVGYSPVTAMCDVYHGICVQFKKQYDKSKKVAK